MNENNRRLGNSLREAFRLVKKMSCSCCEFGLHTKDEPFIDQNRLDVLCPLDNKRLLFQKPMLHPEQQPSRLQTLPIEVYQNCLQFLDIGTLTKMRAVSQYTRASIDSLHPYKEIYQFARQALRACLSMEMAAHIPLLRLHHALTTIECYYCKQSETPEPAFGTYLSLHECRRICGFCARNSPLLKPAELTHLITLCSSRKSPLSASALSSIPHLKTLRGTYALPGDVRIQLSRTVLMLTNSIPLSSARSLTDKEQRLLSASTNTNSTTKITHHPFVIPSDESDISPSIGYTSPETARQISLRFASTISLPYLTPTKTLQSGILCKECNLRMRYLERSWKHEQRQRRIHGGNTIASARRRDKINEARKMASRFYMLDFKGEGGGKVGKELSIKEHYRVEHGKGWMVSDGEKVWRERLKGPALPSLMEGHFWEPPPVRGTEGLPAVDTNEFSNSVA